MAHFAREGGSHSPNDWLKSAEIFNKASTFQNHFVQQLILNRIEHDINEPDNNILELLGRRCLKESAKDVPYRATTGKSEQEERDERVRKADQACKSAAREMKLSDECRLKSLGAIYYWVEKGDMALKMFRAADPHEKDKHSMARAYMRSRRFHKAVVLFDHMLHQELPEAEPWKTLKAIEWNCGAGHCAGSGGRPSLARNYYQNVDKLLAGRKLTNDQFVSNNPNPVASWEFSYYLVDQVLRGEAENEIRFALLSWRTQSRIKHVKNAERKLEELQETLCAIEETAQKAGEFAKPFTIEPLIIRDMSRIALVKGEKEKAAALADQARMLSEPLGEPDTITTCARTRVAAQPDKNLLRNAARTAQQNGRWSEFAKIVAGRIGLHGYGKTSMIQFAWRNASLVVLDYTKEALFSVGGWVLRRR